MVVMNKVVANKATSISKKVNRVSPDPKKRSRKGRAGRKSLFDRDPEFYLQMAKQYARDGLIDKEIAEKFGIHKATLYKWQNKYPELREALRTNKAVVDSQVVDTVIKTIHGFEYQETKVIADPNGKIMRIEKTKKFIPPNITAAIFWMKNRMGWGDRISHDHSGEIKISNPKSFLHEKFSKILIALEKENSDREVFERTNR